jgi:hypothetical protein
MTDTNKPLSAGEWAAIDRRYLSNSLDDADIVRLIAAARPVPPPTAKGLADLSELCDAAESDMADDIAQQHDSAGNTHEWVAEVEIAVPTLRRLIAAALRQQDQGPAQEGVTSRPGTAPQMDGGGA